jgi:hypothetical protein
MPIITVGVGCPAYSDVMLPRQKTWGRIGEDDEVSEWKTHACFDVSHDQPAKATFFGWKTVLGRPLETLKQDATDLNSEVPTTRYFLRGIVR